MVFYRSPDAAIGGFTLIEVLMAVFVLTLALTGMMRMQLTALRAQQQSNNQTAAIRLAAEMAEMIRAWHAPADDRPFVFDYRSGDAIAAGGDCYGGALCNPSALRAFGIGQWLAAIQANLPEARVSICRDATPWSAGARAYAWACNGGANAGIVIKLGWRTQTGGIGTAGSTTPPSAQTGPQLVLDMGDPAR
jgi:type IV pilus assembly protein PilV